MITPSLSARESALNLIKKDAMTWIIHHKLSLIDDMHAGLFHTIVDSNSARRGAGLGMINMMHE